MWRSQAAYVTAYTMKFWGITPEIAIFFGTLSATVLGRGRPSYRSKSIAE